MNKLISVTSLQKLASFMTSLLLRTVFRDLSSFSPPRQRDLDIVTLACDCVKHFILSDTVLVLVVYVNNPPAVAAFKANNLTNTVNTSKQTKI